MLASYGANQGLLGSCNNLWEVLAGLTAAAIKCGLGGPNDGCVKSVTSNFLPKAFAIGDPNLGVLMDFTINKLW
jgi:hypothetical protein